MSLQGLELSLKRGLFDPKKIDIRREVYHPRYTKTKKYLVFTIKVSDDHDEKLLKYSLYLKRC